MSAFRREWRLDSGGLYECRTAVAAVIECPKCGQDVECESETEGWERRNRRWEHTDFGPACGVCCGLLLVDTYDGAQAYVLEEA